MENKITINENEGINPEKKAIINRRVFLTKSGKLITLGALASITMVGGATMAKAQNAAECALEHVPGLCGITDDPPDPCGLSSHYGPWLCAALLLHTGE